MKYWIVTTGKGDVWVVRASSSENAAIDFKAFLQLDTIATIIEATGIIDTELE